jgi:hypothetical protein
MTKLEVLDQPLYGNSNIVFNGKPILFKSFSWKYLLSYLCWLSVLYLLYILIINHTFIIANRVTLLK